MPGPDGGRVQIITDFLRGIGEFDFDRVRGHLADDAVMVTPFIDGLAPTEGAEAIIDQLRSSVPMMFERMVFTCDEFYEVDGSDALIAEYHSVCPRRGGSGTYRNAYITVFRFDEDNRIVLFKEYLNPQRMADLMPSGEGPAH